MSDPVLALILLAAFFVALTLAHSFKTLDAGLWRDSRIPLVSGLVAGCALAYLRDGEPRVVLAALLLTVAAVYVRLTGRESEPADGMAFGSLTGGAAALPLVLTTDSALIELAACVVAGAIAGYGITFGLTHVRDRARQVIVDVVTAVIAVGGAYLPVLLVRAGMRDRHVAIGAVAVVPLVIVGTVFKQWSGVRAELSDEASLGVLDDGDVRATAHPILRLGRGGWHDAHAHREFVRIATKIALRKRQQRGRSEDVARLYQLEVIKLRMEAQEMLRIDRAMRANASDTMPAA